MIKLIVGLKGSGKTKTLISMANAASENSQGSVVCIEKGSKLMFDIKYQVRLIDSEVYMICDAQSLFGFIAGIYASNHDVTDIFIDSALKICNDNMAEFDYFMKEIEKFSEKTSINFVITSSVLAEDLPSDLNRFLV